MGQLRGGTTIGGYTALHSGLKESYMGGNLTLSGNISLNGIINMGVGSAAGINGKDGLPILVDHNNGNVTFSATGGQLYLGYTNTTSIRLEKNLVYGTTNIIDTAGKLYYQGQDTDARYINHTDNHASFDLAGSTSYPRLVANNTGAGSNAWIRVGASGVGLLPYSDGVSQLGTSSWRFAEVHGVTLYENAVSLATKYAARSITLTGGTGITTSIGDLSANRTISLDTAYTDSRYVQSAPGTFTGKLSPLSTNYRSAGMYGDYDSTKIAHVWSMGTAYAIPDNGATFGTLYGMAYKHTNNTTGGTMAGGHQIVFTSAGTPGAAIGLAGNIWTSGTIYEGGTALNTRYAALYHNHDTDYVKLTGGGTIYGTLGMGLTHGISFQTGTTPTIQTSGNWITGGADVADLTKNNNVAIQTWNGFSVSSTISGQVVPRGVPSFSVDARNGHVKVLNDLAAGGGLSISEDAYFGSTVITDRLAGYLGNAVNFGYDSASINYASSMIRLQQGANYIRVGNATTMDMVFASSAGTIFKFSTNPSDFGHCTVNAGNSLLKFLNGGTVGIQVRNSADTGYAALFASAFTVSSSREFKKDITSYQGDAVSKILSTPIREYRYNDDFDWEPKRLGVVVEESPLEIVDLSGKGVDAYPMAAMAWKAIQQLAEENKELKERLSALEKAK